MQFFVLSLEPGPSMYYVSTFWIFLTPSFPMSALLCWKLLFLEIYSKSEIFLSCLKFFFKNGPWRVVLKSGAMWLYSSLSCKKVEYNIQYMPIGPLHRGAFCQFPFRWIYYSYSSKSTGKETGKTHICALHEVHVWNVFWDRTNFFQI